MKNTKTAVEIPAAVEGKELHLSEILKLLHKRCEKLGLNEVELDAKAKALVHIAAKKGYVNVESKDKGAEDGIIFIGQDRKKYFAKVYPLNKSTLTDEDNNQFEISKENRHKEACIFKFLGECAVTQKLYENLNKKYGVLISPSAFENCITLSEYIMEHGGREMKTTHNNVWENIFKVPAELDSKFILPEGMLEASIRVLLAGGDDFGGDNVVIDAESGRIKIVDLLFTSRKDGFLSFQDIKKMKQDFDSFKINIVSRKEIEVFKANRGIAKNILEILTFQQVVSSDEETGELITNGRTFSFKPIFIVLNEICKQSDTDDKVATIINNIAEKLYCDLNSLKEINVEDKYLMFQIHVLKNIRDLDILYENLFQGKLLNSQTLKSIEALLQQYSERSDLDIEKVFDDTIPNNEIKDKCKSDDESEEELYKEIKSIIPSMFDYNKLKNKEENEKKKQYKGIKQLHSSPNYNRLKKKKEHIMSDIKVSV